MPRTATLALLLALSLIATLADPDRAAAARRPGDARASQDDAETVDFGRPPRAGLAFRLRESGVYRVTGRLELGDAWRRSITLDVRQRVRVVQRVEAADATRVRRLVRTYEAHTLEAKQTSRDLDDPEAKPRTETSTRRHPLAGLSVRASWPEKGGVPSLEQREAKTWRAADAAVARRLTSTKLLQPVFPLPAGAKRVGDQWTLRDESLAPYFTDTYSEHEPAPKINGKAEVVFTGFIDHATGRCALLTLTFDVTASYPNLAPHRLQMKGSCLYHLEHRIVVALQAAGSMVARGEMQQGEHRGNLNLSGTIRSQSKVEILTGAKPRDESSADR